MQSELYRAPLGSSAVAGARVSPTDIYVSIRDLVLEGSSLMTTLIRHTVTIPTQVLSNLSTYVCDILAFALLSSYYSPSTLNIKTVFERIILERFVSTCTSIYSLTPLSKVYTPTIALVEGISVVTALADRLAAIKIENIKDTSLYVCEPINQIPCTPSFEENYTSFLINALRTSLYTIALLENSDYTIEYLSKIYKPLFSYLSISNYYLDIVNTRKENGAITVPRLLDYSDITGYISIPYNPYI
jgi:hypothetical protein